MLCRVVLCGDVVMLCWCVFFGVCGCCAVVLCCCVVLMCCCGVGLFGYVGVVLRICVCLCVLCVCVFVCVCLYACL